MQLRCAFHLNHKLHSPSALLFQVADELLQFSWELPLGLKKKLLMKAQYGLNSFVVLCQALSLYASLNHTVTKERKIDHNTIHLFEIKSSCYDV